MGSLRPAGLAKYLPEFGWEAVVLTTGLPGRQKQGYRVIETPYRESYISLKRLLGLDYRQNLMTQIAQLKKKLHIRSEKSLLDFLLTAWGEVTAYPDLQRSWRPLAVKAGNNLLQQESIDAIISTSSPVTCHIVAQELKLAHRLPWIADFRDLWTLNHYYRYSPFRKAVDRRLEHKTIREADALVAVSQPASLKLGTLHRGKRILCITNGFDPAEVNSPEADVTVKFTITYTGNLYPGRQSAEPLFIALRDLIAQGLIQASDTEVRFYGAEVGWIDKQARRHGLKDVVKQSGIVPREIALKNQRESQVLLLIKWNDPGERGAYSAKIFEYLAARRPVLAIGGYHDVVDELLHETNAGNSCHTIEEIKGRLWELYQEYKNTGKAGFKGDTDKIDRYSQREMAQKFAGVLNSVSR